jgi:hypothetical protein
MNFKSLFFGVADKQQSHFVAYTPQTDWANTVQAATLAPPPLPKAPKGSTTYPGYRTDVVAKTSAIAKPSVATVTLDRVTDVRNRSNDYAVLKAMTKASPELSAAVSLTLRTAITPSYTVIGRNLDGQVDPAATAMAHELLRRMTYLGNADGSFGFQQGLQSLSESLALDCLHTGAIGLEVALDKARVPANFNPVAVNTLIFYEEDNAFRVVQKIGGTEVDLDIPTFIYVTLDQTITEAYPTSPLTSVIQAVLTDFEFNNDMRRALKRAVLPRLNSTIDTEKFRKATPPEIAGDPEAYANYQNLAIAAISGVINALAPEDALVSFDMVTHSYIDGGHDPSTIIERVQKVLNAKLVAGSKALPVTLGFASTSGAGSAESLLFLKHCAGIQAKLNEVYSRALTVAVRLMGLDCYVEFAYEEPNLKPQSELEAFFAMKQSRYLLLLSLGLITDDEACIRLTGHLPPPGAPKLSGTMFMDAKSVSTENPSSNTSNASEKNATPDTPTTPKSQNKK